jgi:hypothetical protein
MANRRFPCSGGTIALGAVLLSPLMLALQSVSGIVAEREGRLREAERSVAASSAAQTLSARSSRATAARLGSGVQGEGQGLKTVTERRDYKLSATPATLDVKGDVAIEPRLPRHLQGQRLC